MPYASLACDMTSASEVAVAAWGALQVLYAFAYAFAFAAERDVGAVNVCFRKRTPEDPPISSVVPCINNLHSRHT